MARTLEAFKLHTKLEVDAGSGIRDLQRFEKQLHGISGAFKGGLGVISPQGLAGMKQIEGLGASLKGISGPATAALGAVSGLAAGLAGAGTALYAILKTASDFGGQMHDLSVQTGLGTQTLSAMKFAADQSGASVEDMAKATKSFSLTVAEAARGSEEAEKKLKRLGVDPVKALVDLRGAMSQAMKSISEAPEGIQRTERAADAFGKKLGADLIPTIMSFGGNLDQLEKDVGDLGLALSDVEAAQLDEFGDTTEQLQKQLSGFATQFAVGIVPDITAGMKELSKGMKDNQAAAREWGEEVGQTLRGLRAAAQSELGQAAAAVSGFTVTWLSGAGLLYKFFNYIGSKTEKPMDVSAYAGQTDFNNANKIFGAGAVGGLGRAGAGGGKGGAAKKAEDPLATFKKLAEQASVKLRDLGDTSEETRVRNQFLEAGIEKLNGKLREQAELLKGIAVDSAKAIDVKNALVEATKKHEEEQKQLNQAFKDFRKQQKETLAEARGTIKTPLDEVNEFIATFKLAGGELEDFQVALMRADAMAIQFERDMAALNDTAADFPELVLDDATIEKMEKKLGDVVNEKSGVPPEMKEKLKKDWGDLFAGAFQDGIAGLIPQQEKISKKRSLWSKILGIAAPFLSFIPGAGPILSTIAGAASQGVGGDWGSAMGTVAGGFAKGGAFRPADEEDDEDEDGSGGMAGSALSRALAGARAGGGPVYAGQPYLVGEHGAEIFAPSSSGYVYPNGGGGAGAIVAAAAELRAAVAHLNSMPASHVVMRGARGLVKAMDHDAGLIRLVSQRQRLA